MQNLIFEILITKICLLKNMLLSHNLRRIIIRHLFTFFALNICYLTPNIKIDEMFKSLGEICIQF